MTAIPPVATPAPEPSSQVGTSSRLDASLTPERQMFEYSLQVQQANVANGGSLANPAAMASEMLNSLRGFLERAQRMQKRVQEAHGGHHSNVRTADASAGNLASLPMHGGPARENLEPIDGDSAASNLANVEQWADRMFDEMYDDSILNFQTTMIGGTIARTTSSINTLLKG